MRFCRDTFVYQAKQKQHRLNSKSYIVFRDIKQNTKFKIKMVYINIY